MGGQFGSAADGADSDGDVSTNYCTLATADLDDRSADASGDAALDSELCGGEVATRRRSGNSSAHNGNGNGNGIAGSRIAEATLRQWIESWISFCQKKEVTFHDYERAVESFRSVLDSHLRREELQRSLCVIEREYLGERVASSEERVAALESRRKELELQWAIAISRSHRLEVEYARRVAELEEQLAIATVDTADLRASGSQLAKCEGQSSGVAREVAELRAELQSRSEALSTLQSVCGFCVSGDLWSAAIASFLLLSCVLTHARVEWLAGSTALLATGEVGAESDAAVKCDAAGESASGGDESSAVGASRRSRRTVALWVVCCVVAVASALSRLLTR